MGIREKGKGRERNREKCGERDGGEEGRGVMQSEGNRMRGPQIYKAIPRERIAGNDGVFMPY